MTSGPETWTLSMHTRASIQAHLKYAIMLTTGRVAYDPGGGAGMYFRMAAIAIKNVRVTGDTPLHPGAYAMTTRLPKGSLLRDRAAEYLVYVSRCYQQHSRDIAWRMGVEHGLSWLYKIIDEMDYEKEVVPQVTPPRRVTEEEMAERRQGGGFTVDEIESAREQWDTWTSTFTVESPPWFTQRYTAPVYERRYVMGPVMAPQPQPTTTRTRVIEDLPTQTEPSEAPARRVRARQQRAGSAIPRARRDSA